MKRKPKPRIDPLVLMEIRHYTNAIENAAIQAYARKRKNRAGLRKCLSGTVKCLRMLMSEKTDDCPWPIKDGECKPPSEV